MYGRRSHRTVASCNNPQTAKACLAIFLKIDMAEEYSQRYDAVYDCRSAMLLVSLSAEEIENLANSDDVVSISQGYKAKPMLEI